MANEAQGSTTVDPLVNYWGLSLFPQTSGVPPDPSKPYNPDVDLDTIHNHLRSMALRSPSKQLLEQAKSIIDGNPGLFEVLGDPASYEINDVVSEEAKENPRERRPALGHKRARFCLKPNKNHPTEILKPSLDIDNLKDPEEFFMAHERLENANREIQKQMGNISFEPKQNYTSANGRQRRPGLLGNNQRRSVRYKHRYSIETTDINEKENVPFSQETFISSGLGPVGESIEKAGDHLASLGSEITESSAMEENKLNNILDELLHSSEDLEGDQAITLLQESLQIKPIVLEKLSIPDLPDNRVTELKTFGGYLSKPRKPLMSIDNLLDINSVTPVKLRRDVGSPGQQLASPTPPRSPFGLLSMLQKRISQSRQSVDPFSALHCDDLSIGNSSVTDMTKQGLSLVDSGKPYDKLNEPLGQDIKSSVEQTVRTFATTSGKSKEDNSREPAFGTNTDSNESRDDIEVDTEGRNMGNSVVNNAVSVPNSEANEPCEFNEDTVRTFNSTSGKSNEDNSTELAFGTNDESNKSHVDMEVDVGGSDVSNRNVDDTINWENYEANEPCEFVDKVQEIVAPKQTDDRDPYLVNPLDQSSPAWFEANSVDENTRTLDDGPEQCLQVQEKTESSQVSVDKQRKVIPRSRKRKDKGLSRRQSLAVAGTSWESGVRRSTRIRTRPLEYWKGERPVYGRVHESLATVIGVKCISPGTADGKPTMKVKSYVSDKYKEILELASQY